MNLENRLRNIESDPPTQHCEHSREAIPLLRLAIRSTPLRLMIILTHGRGSRTNFVSSLRKDSGREVDACTTSRRSPEDLAYQRGPLDVESIFWRLEDDRRLRTLFGAASRCHRTAHCGYFTPRPFYCSGFPSEHCQQPQLDALVDYSIWRGPRASPTRCPGQDLQAAASGKKCGWRAPVPSKRS